jgi:hypothetical protein
MALVQALLESGRTAPELARALQIGDQTIRKGGWPGPPQGCLDVWATCDFVMGLWMDRWTTCRCLGITWPVLWMIWAIWRKVKDVGLWLLRRSPGEARNLARRQRW